MKHKRPHIEKNEQFFEGDIKKIAMDNEFFRRVIYTGPRCQLAVMSIPAGGDSDEEIHANADQIAFIVDGEGEAVLNGRVQPGEKHCVIFVTAGTRHHVRNTGYRALKLVTVYAPPGHADGTVHHTKEEAMQEEHA